VAGGRLPVCSTKAFPERAAKAIPAQLAIAAKPLVEQIAQLNLQLATLDREIAGLDQKYPEIAILQSAPGVGPLVAACYVLTLDRAAMRDNRQAGAFLGLRPRQSQSGDSNPQHGIAKTGNTYLRSLLVQSAHYVLGRFGPDSALRRWGLKLAAGGGARAKKRAVVAIARKLAVMLHSMWRNRTLFQPFPQPAAAAA
jgi:transposase